MSGRHITVAWAYIRIWSFAILTQFPDLNLIVRMGCHTTCYRTEKSNNSEYIQIAIHCEGSIVQHTSRRSWNPCPIVFLQSFAPLMMDLWNIWHQTGVLLILVHECVYVSEGGLLIACKKYNNISENTVKSAKFIQ